VRSRAWVAWAFMLPVLLVMAVIVFYPLVLGVFQTFTDINNQNQGTRFKPPSWEFVGLQNYIDILSGKDTHFYPVLGWTIAWTVINVFFHYTIGLALALALNQGFRGRTAYRLILLLPWAVPAYITAIAWLFIFNGEYGLLNNVLGSLGMPRVPWLATWPWYYVMPIIVNVWLGIPFMMVTLLGGLQSIPNDLYEAAAMDGASRRQSFWNITLPQLSSVSTTVILLGCIWTFNIFVVIYFITGGGPGGKTDILVTYTYNGFTLGQYAIAATYGVIIFSLLLVFSAVYRRWSRAS
jgi:arabinogalactan oligomer / maltooligosaccharide transport system permease protein